RERRRARGKDRPRLDRELGVRHVRRRELEGFPEVAARTRDILYPQRVTEIEGEVSEVRGVHLLGGTPRLGGRVNAPEHLEPLLVEALGAERYPRDARRAVFAKGAALDRAGVCFEGPLEAGGQLEHAARRRQQLTDRTRREEARRP